MKASLEPPWWQRFGLRDLIIVAVAMACGIYLFDPPIQQPGAFTGQVRDIVQTEHPKTGFRQLALVKLTSGELVQAKVSLGHNREVSVGDIVSLHEYKTLRRHRIKFIVVPDVQSH